MCNSQISPHQAQSLSWNADMFDLRSGAAVALEGQTAASCSSCRPVDRPRDRRTVWLVDVWPSGNSGTFVLGISARSCVASPVDGKVHACHIAGLIGGQEADTLRNLDRRGDAPHWDPCCELS